MPTISMFYGILILMYFMIIKNMPVPIFMRNMGNSWQL